MSEKLDIDGAIKHAIEGTGVAEVVRLSSDDSKVHALCRVQHKRPWCEMLEYVLTRKTCWEDHICQQYFIRGSRLVYGWNVIIQPTNGLDAAVSEFYTLMLQATKIIPQMRGPTSVDTFPLVGASPRRQSTAIAFDPRLPGPDRGGPSHKGAFGIKGE